MQQYETLNNTEMLLLTIHTLFNTNEEQVNRVRRVMEKITRQPCVEYNVHVDSLHEKGFLNASNYNWRNSTYDYSIMPELMVPTMLYLVEQQKALLTQVLDAATDMLQPTPIQRYVWNYIISDFHNLRSNDIESYHLRSASRVLLPVVCDKRFLSMLQSLGADTLFELLSDYLSDLFANERLIDLSYLQTLIQWAMNRDSSGVFLRMQCLADLYGYLAYGRMPANLYEENKNHRIIAALHEAYNGRLTQSLEHFKRAVTLNNRASGRMGYVVTKSYLPISIANFFFVLVAYMTNTEEGRKKCLSVIRTGDPELILAARTLYMLLTASFTEHQMEASLQQLLASGSRINRTMAVLLCRYADRLALIHQHGTTDSEAAPQWLIMKHEMRRYYPLNNEETVNKIYSPQPLLTSIHRKQQWEMVIEDLMGLNTPSAAAASSDRKQFRIGYYLNSMQDDTVQIRQQTLRKNGQWSMGRRINVSNFVEGNIEGMSGSDRRISQQISSDMARNGVILLSTILPEMSSESHLYVGVYAPCTLVQVIEEMPYLTLEHTDDGFNIVSNVPAAAVEQSVIISHRGASSINFIRMTEEQRPFYRKLLGLTHMPPEAEEPLRALLASLGNKIEINSDLIEGGSTLPITDGTSQLTLQMRPHGKEHYIATLFVRPLDSGRIHCTPGEGTDIIVDEGSSGRTRVKRDLETERQNMQHLISQCQEVMSLQQMQHELTEVSPFDLLPIIEYAQTNPERIVCEWPEGAQIKISYRQGGAAGQGSIRKTDNGWFELEGSVEIDQGRVMTMAQLMELTRQSHGRFIRLDDGEYLSLSEKLRQQLQGLSTLAARQRGRLVISPFSAALLGADILEGELQITEDSELTKIRQRIREASEYTPEVPRTLHATLREYQREGYVWMSRLNEWGAGALLADDMGLGKTIQTITFLLSKAEEGPALVIAPASVAPNWRTEFQKFAPTLRITMLNFEADRAATIEKAHKGDVVVTTYGLLLSVKDFVTAKSWTTICLDEAHIVKNRGAKTSAVAMQLSSRYRIMLTGTPVQNHLGELWNLFQFVNPGLLGSFEDFNRRFIIPIEQEDNRLAQQQLDRLVKPFMLRRTKDKVARELPEKEEIYQHVTLTDDERLTYEALRQRAETMLLNDSHSHLSITTLAEITRLRQCACDVRLVERNATAGGSSAAGSKITALVELLQTILESLDSGGVLVFSQFTSYLALIKRALDDAQIPYLYIDGTINIKERQRLVERFQSGQCPVFLISLKAGGLGLNLTRANYVVHMDPWWNPAIEAQATDRAHRIGQQQRVTVYHLIAEGTIEEKIQRMHEQKRELVDSVLQSTDKSYRMTGEELLRLIHNA